MKSRFNLILITFFLSQFILPEKLSALTIDKVLATINNKVITLSDYKKYIKLSGYTEDIEEVDKNILKQLIEEQIILYEAERKRIEVTEDEINSAIENFKEENNITDDILRSTLKEENISFEEFKNNLKNKIIIAKLVQSEIESKIIITDKEIINYYETNKTKYLDSPLSVYIKAIYLKLKENASVTELTDLKLRALKLHSMLMEGDSFDRLVIEYSDEPFKSNGGILGIFHKGTLLPPLDEKAFAMKKGEISEPIWVEDGVYIIQIVDIFPEVYKTVEDVKNEIYSTLLNQKKESYYNNWIKILWEKMSVKILENH